MFEILFSQCQSEFHAVSFVYHVVCVVCSLMWTGSYCYYATLATERLLVIDQNVYDLKWYDYPPNIQKYIGFMMMRSQESVYFTGFGLFGCTLEIFGKVMI